MVEGPRRLVVALDTKTGEEKWRTERPGGTSWTTPIIVATEAGAQAIVGTRKTTAYDVETGKVLWSSGEDVDGFGGGTIPSPVHSDGLVLVVAGGRRGALSAVRIAASEGEERVAWTHSGDTPQVASPIVYDGLVYMIKSNTGMLSALDLKTGEVKYGPERMAGLGNTYASPVATSGRLYFADRDGVVEVIAAGPEFKSLAVNTLEEAATHRPRSWATSSSCARSPTSTASRSRSVRPAYSFVVALSPRSMPLPATSSSTMPRQWSCEARVTRTRPL